MLLYFLNVSCTQELKSSISQEIKKAEDIADVDLQQIDSIDIIPFITGESWKVDHKDGIFLTTILERFNESRNILNTNILNKILEVSNLIGIKYLVDVANSINSKESAALVLYQALKHSSENIDGVLNSLISNESIEVSNFAADLMHESFFNSSAEKREKIIRESLENLDENFADSIVTELDSLNSSFESLLSMSLQKATFVTRLAKNNRIDILSAIYEKEPKLFKVQDKDLNTPIHLLLEHGSSQELLDLLKIVSNEILSLRNYAGQDVTVLSAELGLEDVLSLLLDRKSDKALIPFITSINGGRIFRDISHTIASILDGEVSRKMATLLKEKASQLDLTVTRKEIKNELDYFTTSFLDGETFRWQTQALHSLNTALQNAVRADNFAMIREVVDENTPISLQNVKGRTVLHDLFSRAAEKDVDIKEIHDTAASLIDSALDSALAISTEDLTKKLPSNILVEKLIERFTEDIDLNVLKKLFNKIISKSSLDSKGYNDAINHVTESGESVVSMIIEKAPDALFNAFFDSLVSVGSSKLIDFEKEYKGRKKVLDLAKGRSDDAYKWLADLAK